MLMVCTLRATGMNNKDVYYLNNEKPWVGKWSVYRQSLLTSSHGDETAAECEVLHEEAGAPREERDHLSWCVPLIHEETLPGVLSRPLRSWGSRIPTPQAATSRGSRMTMLELEALRLTPETTGLEKRLVVAKGQGLERAGVGVRVSRCKLLCTE